MQQGVLEPNSSSELWEFTNPNFQRDQQHLLPLVTRKKALHPTIEHPDGAGGPGGDDGPSGSGSGSGKGVDVPAILNSIATIRAQQTALSADLKELQQSNQHLWTEALAARERHKQHQDTTDRILRFLAGVFGQGAAGDIASGVNGDSGNQSVSSAVRAAKESMLASSLASGGVSAGAGVSGARSGSTTGAGSSGILARNRGLMIQAGQAKTPSLAADNDGLQSTLTHEEPLEEISAGVYILYVWSLVSKEFPLIAISFRLVDRFMEVQTTPTPTPSTEQGAPSPFPPTLARSTSTALVPRVAQPQDQQPSSYHPQPNGDIGQYFNFSGQPQSGGSSTALDAFTPSFLADFASAVGPLSPATLGALSAPTPQSDPAGVSSTALQQQQAASSQALERSYQSADAISTEVDTLQASIEDLVASLGLSGEMRSDGTWDPPPAEHVSDVAGQYTGSDFDMESFLSDLTGSAPTPAATTGATPSAIPEVNSSEQSPTSSLGADESPALVPTIETPGTTATGTTVASPQTDGEQSSKRSKRKSDVSLVEPDAKSQRLA